MLLQLHPSPFANQLLTTLHTWITKLKSSFRINLDHSFQSRALFEDLSPPLLPSTSTSQQEQNGALAVPLSLSSSSHASAPSPALTPAQAAHHILLKALPIALQITLLADVTWLCKSLLTFVIPRYTSRLHISSFFIHNYHYKGHSQL